MRFVKPLDEELLLELAVNHKHFFCIEDNSVVGGAGSAVAEWAQKKGLMTHVHINGLSDHFPSQGSRSEVLSDYHLDFSHLEEKISRLIES